jgi:hypothetical protein
VGSLATDAQGAHLQATGEPEAQAGPSGSRRPSGPSHRASGPWNSTLKSELGEQFDSPADAKAKLFDYIEVFYNQTRLGCTRHSTTPRRRSSSALPRTSRRQHDRSIFGSRGLVGENDGPGWPHERRSHSDSVLNYPLSGLLRGDRALR